MLFKKDELKILWPFYLYCLTLGLSMMLDAYFIIYFVDLGYSFFQISLLFSSLFITMFLLEIPTGAFADSRSRKQSVIVGLLITGASIALMPFTRIFFISLLLWIIAGVGLTFISGAEEAWVVSNLKKENKNNLVHEYFIKSNVLVSIGMVVAPLIGSLLIKKHPLSILWYIYGIGFLASATILAIFAKELAPPKRKHIITAIKELFSRSRKSFRIIRNNQVLFLLLAGSCAMALIDIGHVAEQPFLVSLGMEKPGLGVVSSVLAAFSVLTYFSARFLAKFKPAKVMIILILSRALILLGFLFVAPSAFILAAAMFIVSDGISRLKSPVLQPYFHKCVPESHRATITSINNMGASLAFSTVTVFSGILLGVIDMRLVIALGGVLGILAIYIYSKLNRIKIMA